MGRRVRKFDGPSGRGLWWRLTPQITKKGRGWRRRLCRRVASLRSGGDSGSAAEGGGGFAADYKKGARLAPRVV